MVKRVVLKGLLLAAAAASMVSVQAAPVQWTVASGGNGHWSDRPEAGQLLAGALGLMGGLRRHRAG